MASKISRKVRSALGVLLTITGSAAAEQEGLTGQWRGKLLPLASVLADPDRHSGELIDIAGYLLINDEQSALCPQRRVASTLECILVLNTKVLKVDGFHGRPVMIEGNFTARRDAPNYYVGEISAIRIMSLPEIHDYADEARKE